MYMIIIGIMIYEFHISVLHVGCRTGRLQIAEDKHLSERTPRPESGGWPLLGNRMKPFNGLGRSPALGYLVRFLFDFVKLKLCVTPLVLHRFTSDFRLQKPLY